MGGEDERLVQDKLLSGYALLRRVPGILYALSEGTGYRAGDQGGGWRTVKEREDGFYRPELLQDAVCKLSAGG